MGCPIISSGGRPSAVGSGPWTSYTISAPSVRNVWVCVAMARTIARARQCVGEVSPYLRMTSSYQSGVP
jgi:hypothetical protein